MTEEEMNQTPQPEESGVNGGIAYQVQGETVEVQGSLVGAVNANQNANIGNSLALAVMSGANASLDNSASSVIMAGENVEITNGGAGFILTGGNVEISNGGAGAMICQQATVKQATINVLLANQVELGEDTKILFSTRQAAAFGAAFGVVVAILTFLFRRRR
jgi:hypothetical protein